MFETVWNISEDIWIHTGNFKSGSRPTKVAARDRAWSTTFVSKIEFRAKNAASKSVNKQALPKKLQKKFCHNHNPIAYLDLRKSFSIGFEARVNSAGIQEMGGAAF